MSLGKDASDKTIHLRNQSRIQRDSIDHRQVAAASNLVELIQDLPPLPKTTAIVMRELESPEISLQQIAQSISRDPPLASRVLRLANSPTFFRGKEATTVLQALTMLGLAKTKAVVSAANLESLRVRFSGEQRAVLEQLQDTIWRNSFATAIAAQEAALLLRRTDSDELFVAGLLHDLGKFAFMFLLPSKYADVHSAATQEKELLEAEVQHLGFAHPMVGTFVAQRWFLPIDLCEIIRVHHETYEPPFKTSIQEKATLVATADLLAHAVGFGYQSAQAGILKRAETLGARLGIQESEIASLAARVTERIEKEATSFIGNS